MNCPNCYGSMFYIGTLGKREWFKCPYCHTESYKGEFENDDSDTDV